MSPLNTLFKAIFGVASVLLLGKIAQILYTASTSPLRHIPGPWWSHITRLPTKFAVVSARQVHFFHSLHNRYGRFVRVGPNEIIVNDLAAFKEVHRIGTPFVKTRFYNFLNPTEPGEPPYGLFAETDPARHARHRKLLARGFTLPFLRSTWEPSIHAKVSETVQCIKRVCDRDGEVDVLKWWRLMAGDIISLLMFGEAFGLVGLGHNSEWYEALVTGTKAGAIAWHFPWLYEVLKIIPHPKIQALYTSRKRIIEDGHKAVTNSRTTASSRNIFAAVLEQAEKGDGSITDLEMVVEATTFIIGGTDTTATTLAYLVWAVLSDPALQKVLEEEVSKIEEPLLDANLVDLPILTAVINETLRLYGASPGALYRVAPMEIQLGGYTIPAGTTVSTQAWTAHRDAEVFENPDTFDYTRWLGPMSGTARAVFSPLGAGTRGCVGRELAYMELRLATAVFFRACRGATLAPSTSPESMAVKNTFLISPKSGECKIVAPKA